MPRAVLVVPGRLDERTGGYIYDRRIVDGLRERGWQVDVVELDASFPHPTPAALAHAADALAALPADAIVVVDSLALGAMPDVVVREASRLPLVALVHLPLGAAYGLEPAAAARFEYGERRALQAAALTVVTGRATLPLLARYGVAPERVVVVEPGTDRPEGAGGASLYGSPGTPPIELLCVATVNRGKGHELLLEALAGVSFDWHLTCAGSLTRDAEAVARVRLALSTLKLEDRVTLAGDLDAATLAERYQRADLFVLATFQETYGMAIAEALARGLPVVATAVGAISDLVGDEAGIVVPPGDAAALAAALNRIGTDASLRARLAEGARRRGTTLPTWADAAAQMDGVLRRLADRKGPPYMIHG